MQFFGIFTSYENKWCCLPSGNKIKDSLLIAWQGITMVTHPYHKTESWSSNAACGHKKCGCSVLLGQLLDADEYSVFVSANDDVGFAKNWKFESSRGFCSLFQPIRAMGPLIFRAGPTNANFWLAASASRVFGRYQNDIFEANIRGKSWHFW